MSTPEISAGTLLLAEYERLKEEQKARIGFRDNLMYATLAILAGIIAATLGNRSNAGILLLVPPVSAILGWTYVANDERITAIGRYVRGDLGPRLAALAGTSDTVFGWESWHRSDSDRALRKAMQLTVDLTLFCGSGLIAILVFYLSGSVSPILLGVSIVELVVALVLAGQIVRYALVGQRN